VPQLAAVQAQPLDPFTHVPRVYSYTRFSTPEQAQGDSLRRQTEGARKWTERKNAQREASGLPPVALDHKLNLFDLGVSAFRGANTEGESALGGFLFACRQGLIPAGSYLLVESLDRISRMTPRRVQRVLDDIVDAGVTIATLNDGQEYDRTRLDNDPTALLIALMVSWRAHEESKVKAQRLSAAWTEKRRRIRSGEDAKLTAQGPSWLQWTPEGWAERQPHSDTVRRIYRLTLEGIGENKIAQMLNGEGVPVMGKGKMWHRSTVSKVLRSSSAMGTLIPGRLDYSEGKKVRKFEEGVPGAYPAVVSEADWLAVRALKDGKAPAARGRGAAAPLSNLFSGLSRCPECGAAMTRVYKGKRSKAGPPKLVCTRAKAGAASHPYRSVSLDLLHSAFEDSWQALVASIPAGDAGGSLDRECDNLEAVIAVGEDELDRLTDLCLRVPSEALAGSLRRKEAELHSHRAELARLEEERAVADHGLTVARVEALMDAMERGEGEPLDIAKVNAALRVLFEGVTVDYLTGRLCFRWRQGGVSTFMYEWRDTEPAN
jgi:DNA invertase Pin-like site-specific DNA recombinase